MSKQTQKVRTWPLWTLLAVETTVLFILNTGEAEARQVQVALSLLSVTLSCVLVMIWFFFFSRLPARIRLFGLAGAVVVGIAFLLVFEIREFSGDLMPLIVTRWSPSYEDLATDIGESSAIGAVESGLNDFPRYLGPNGNNTVTGTLLAHDWASDPPRERWRIQIGAGWSSFAIQGNLAVTQEQRGERGMVTCYDLLTGSPLWGHGDDNFYTSSLGGDGPRSTPTLFDGMVYTWGPRGLLNCLQLANGKLIWQRQAAEEAGSKAPEWGYAGSPLVIDDLVVVAPGSPGGQSLIAFNRHDGARLWGQGDGQAGYSTPQLMTLAGKPQIVVFYHDSVASHDPENGNVLWKTGWGEGSPTAANPLQLPGNRLLVSSGYGQGSALYEITRSGDRFDLVKRYESTRLKAKFANYVPFGDSIYGLDDGILVGFNPQTGERLWKRGRFGHGQLLLVEDLLLIQSERGSLHLIEPNPNEFRELAMIPVLSGKAWNNMAISANLLLLRNHREAVCLELPMRRPGS